MAHDPKKKKKSDDDELFPDAPVSKKSKTTKQEKPRERAPEKPEKSEPPKTKTTRVEKKPEPAAAPEPPPKTKTNRVERPEKVEKAPAPAPAARSGPNKTLLVGGGLVAALLGGAIIVGPTLLQTDETKRPSVIKLANNPPPPPPAPAALKPRNEPVTPAATQPQPQPTAIKATPSPQPAAQPQPAAAAKPQPTKKSRDELSKRSANHSAIAKVLELFDAVRQVDLTSDDRLFEDFQAKQRKEQELIEQIRGLGIAGLGALKEMILELDDGGYRLLLAKAVAGMNSPEALKTTAEVLASVQDIAVQTTLVRFLPETPEAASVVAGAFGTEGNPNVRSMLLREYARRLGEPDLGEPDMGRPRPAVDKDSGREVFRKAALEDQDPSVRAEAVAIIGRRSDPRDMDLMAQIMKSEPNLQIRQAAIVAYATTGNENALGELENLARRDDSLEIRASAVLGIARIGNDRAIQILDQIAQTDPREEIRMRASGFAQGLRAKNEADRMERNRPQVDQTPVPLDPGGQPRGE